MKECYICTKLKEKGRYRYSNNYTTLCITKGDNGRYRIFARGEYEASISCNYCPNCGKELEKNIYSIRSDNK